MRLDDFPNLEEAIKERRCVLFVGAGVSATCDRIPSGGTLSQGFADKAQLCLQCENSKKGKGKIACRLEGYCKWPLQTVARYYEVCYDRDSLRRELKRIFDPQPPLDDLPKAHVAIARLHPFFGRIITTNYDKLLEEAYRVCTPAVACEVIHRDTEVCPQDDRPCLVKMHGCIGRVTQRGHTLVITDDDYYEMLSWLKGNPDSLMHRLLKDYLCDYQVIFVGYSLSDSTFRMLHEDIRQAVGKDALKKAYALRKPIPRPNKHQRRVRDLDAKYWEAIHKIKIIDMDLLQFLEEVEAKVGEVRAKELLAKAARDGTQCLGESEFNLTKGLDIQVQGRESILLWKTWMSYYQDMAKVPGRADSLSPSEVKEICDDVLGTADPQKESNFGNPARFNAVSILAKIPQDERWCPYLLKGLQDQNATVYTAAIDALAQYPAQWVFDELYRLVMDHPRPEVRARAARTLARLASKKEVRRTLRIRFRREPTIEVRRKILPKFELSGDGAAQIVSIGLYDTDQSVVSVAIETLGHLADPRSLGYLKWIARNGNPHHRKLAVEAVRKIPLSKNIRFLIYVLKKEKDKDLREAAIQSLISIVQTPVNDNPEDNRLARQMGLDFLVDIDDVDRVNKINFLLGFIDNRKNCPEDREFAVRKLSGICEPERLPEYLSHQLSEPGDLDGRSVFDIIVEKAEQNYDIVMGVLLCLVEEGWQANDAEKITRATDWVRSPALSDPLAVPHLRSLVERIDHERKARGHTWTYEDVDKAINMFRAIVEDLIASLAQERVET